MEDLSKLEPQFFQPSANPPLNVAGQDFVTFTDVDIADLSLDCQFYPIGSTPLHLAANNNDIKTLLQLLYSYSDLSTCLDLTDGHGRTPLVVALQNGRMKAAYALIQAGASLKVFFRDNTTVLDVLSQEKVFLPLLSILANTNALAHLTPECVTPLLHYLSYQHKAENDLRKIETILRIFPNVINMKDHLGLTALHYAVISRDLELVQLLLRFSPKLKLRNPYGSTVLHTACGNGHLEAVQAILEEDTDPASLLNAQDQLDRTPLHIAMYSKQLATVHFIIEKFASLINKKLRDNLGHTVTTLLFTLRFSLSLKIEQTISIPCLTQEEATWLLHDCVYHGNVEGVTSALSQGAKVNSFDLTQHTPLLLASKLGHTELCEALVAGGADPNVCDESLKTPIHYACKLERIEVFKYLLTVENINLQLFYQTYDDPLTVEQVECLINYYGNAVSPQLPQSWLEWLSLAASNPAITAQLFSLLAQHTCPPDWLEQLASGSNVIQDELVLVPDNSRSYPVLSALVQKPEITKRPSLYSRQNSYQYFLIRRPIKEVVKEVKGKPLTPTKRSAPFHFKMFRQNKRRKIPRKNHYFGPKGCLKSFPAGNQLMALLHTALVYKNFSVLTYLLTRALETVPDCTAILFSQGQGGGQDMCTFIDTIGENFEYIEGSLDSLGVTEVVKNRLMNKDPSDFRMAKALLLYLISGTVKHYYRRPRSKVVIRKPFPSWPMWYIILRCKWFLQALGWKEEIIFSTSEDREKLANFLLENCNKDVLMVGGDSSNSASFDPCFLKEAVDRNCVWAVQLLLKHGNQQYQQLGAVLVKAIKSCRIYIIDSLLDAWPHDFNQHSQMGVELLKDLCRSLLVLASHGEARTIQRIISTFDLHESERLWNDFSGPRLLYLLLLSDSCLCVQLGERLTKSAASFLCHTLLHSPVNTCAKKGVFFLSTYLIAAKLSPERDLTSFLTICLKSASESYGLNIASLERSFHPRAADVLNYACERGMHNVVSLYLSHLKLADLEFSKNQTGENSPLYLAAYSGDYDTIMLLSKYGFKPLIFEHTDPPLYRYLLYLVRSKSDCPHRVSVCRSPHCLLHSNTGVEQQKAVVDILMPSQEYLRDVLKTRKFPFHHLAQLIELQIGERILSEVMSLYRSDTALAKTIDWVSVAFQFSVRIFKFSTQKLKKISSLLDDFLVEIFPSVTFEENDCLYVAKAGMWSFSAHMLQSVQDMTAISKDCLRKVLVLASKHGSVEALQVVYSMISANSSHWIHSETHQYVETAVQNKQTDVLDYLFSQIKTKISISEALQSVVKFGDMACFSLVLQQVLHSHSNVLEDSLQSLVTTASLYNRKDILGQIKSHFLSSSLAPDYEEKEILLYSTSLKAAVKRGHVSLALNALDTLPSHLLHRVTEDQAFHSILYWCCYWGSVEVLERLPFTPEQLWRRESTTDFSPWECALIHGHVGKISRLANVPTWDAALPLSSLFEDNPMEFTVNDLVVGAFGQLMAISQPGSASVACVSNCSIFGTDNYIGKKFNVCLEATTAMLMCLGKYVGGFICQRHTRFMDPISLINEESFELLLDALQEVDCLQHYFTSVSSDNPKCFSQIVASGSVRRVRALLDRGVDILANDDIHHPLPTDSLLHTAVCTKNPEMVELILNLYADNAPEACFKVNYENEYPLYLAFALGATSVLSQTSLLRTALRAANQENRWTVQSLRAYGWFHYMMEINEKEKKDSQNDQSETTFLFNIRKASFKNNVGFLKNAIKAKNFPVAVSMIAATGGFLSGKPEDLAFFSIKGGPDVYTCNDLVREPVWSCDFSRLFTKLLRGYQNDDEMLLYIKYHGLAGTDEVLTIFKNACCLNKHRVVQELLDQRAIDETVRSALGVSALEEGFLLAVASGYYTTAACLSMETGVTLDSLDRQFLPLVENIPELSTLIFSTVDYYNLLEKFFHSVCSKERLPLASAWLGHNWTQLESQLLVKQLGNTSYAPSNPWQLPLTKEDGVSTEVLVTIDWDSFSESFLTSPMPDSIQAKHQFTPLLVEAIVFSSAILGQVCGEAGSDRVFNPLFFFSKLFELSTMIITAQAWPATPSFKVYGDQGVLTLSCKPSDGSVMFPSLDEGDTYSERLPLPLEDSIVQSSFNSSTISTETPDPMMDRWLYFKRLLKKALWQGAVVTIDYDQNIAHLSSEVTRAMFNVIEAIKLVLNLNVLYSGLCSEEVNGGGGKAILSICGNLPLLNALHIQLNSSDKYSYIQSDYEAPVSVTRQGGALVINLIISSITKMDESLLDPETENGVFEYEALVAALTKSLLEVEKEATLALVKSTISKKILPNLSHSLKIGTLDEDFVTIGMQENDDYALHGMHTLSDLDRLSLPQVKSLSKLANLVNYFAKLLQVFSYKPKLIRGMFDGGLRVLLCDKEATSFSVIGGHSLLKFSLSDLHNKTNADNMIHVFESIMTAATSRGQRRFESVEFPLNIPAPFRCCLDLDKSTGYLFPVRGERGIMTVQLVDFSGNPLGSLPTNQCTLSVSIKDSNSAVLSANSSTDPHPKTASKHLLISLKAEGVFEVQWTPQSEGLHDISISLNRVPIKGSPFRAYCTTITQAGYRQVLAGSKLQFIVTHSGHSCGHVQPLINLPLSVKPLITPMCLKAIEPFVEASKRNREFEPATGCVRVDPPPKSAKSDPQSPDTGVPHYISMLCKHRPSSQWIYRTDKNISVYVCKTEEKKRSLPFVSIHTIPLSKGTSLVSISVYKACVLKVFAACTRCQAVLTTHWIDHRGIDPTLCYVTPGPICKDTSIVMYRNTKIRKNKGQIEITAAEVKPFLIKAYDKFYNQHNIGGAITSAILKASSSSTRIAREHSHLVPPVQNVVCGVQDNQNGTYTVTVNVNVVGEYTLVVNNEICLLEVSIVSGPPKAANCKLLSQNQYKVSACEVVECDVALFDNYFNPCVSNRWIRNVRGVLANYGSVSVEKSSHFVNVARVLFRPQQVGWEELEVYISDVLLPGCPICYTVLKKVKTFSMRYSELHLYLNNRYGNTQTSTFTVERDNVLESAMQVFAVHNDYFHKRLRVRFRDEPGIDAGGVAREFYHLLSLELVNPQYAMFECINSLYKPSQSSHINQDHLTFFTFFGKILGRVIAEGHQMPVRFTPSVYKYLLNQECSLDDLKMEDPTLYMSLLTIANCDSEEAFEELAINFTAQRSHFGAVHTIELEEGGEGRSVTMANKKDFVKKLCFWHLVECIKDQLKALRSGLSHVIDLYKLADFSAHELEVILSGQSEVNVSFIRGRTTYSGYSPHNSVSKWLWEVLEELSYEERCRFLQFSTGCSSLPSAELTEWKFRVQRGSPDTNMLPEASTCFNSITLPVYKDKETLRQKLKIAISYGHQGFLIH